MSMEEYGELIGPLGGTGFYILAEDPDDNGAPEEAPLPETYSSHEP